MELKTEMSFVGPARSAKNSIDSSNEPCGSTTGSVHSVEALSKKKEQPEDLVRNGDFNDLLDREILKVNLPDTLAGARTHPSSQSKSPLETYTD